MTLVQKILATLVSLVFLLFGTGLFLGITIRPIRLAQQTQSWVPTDCSILSSVLRTDRSTAEPTYEAEVRFRYRFKRQTYISSTYNLSSNYSGDRFAKEAILARYPVAKETTCYVNPTNPNEAVLDRNKPSDIWFGLIGLPFLLVGLGVFGYVIAQSIKPLMVRPKQDAPQTPGIQIKPVKSGQGLALVVLTLLWNIFMLFAIYMVAREWKTRPNYVAAVILFVFSAVGILLLISMASRLIAILSPAVEFKVFGYRLGAGERFELSWSISRASLLIGAEIWLKYGVQSVPVYISHDINVPARGQTSVKIPEDMPTNEPALIRFVGYVKRLPDVEKQFVVTLN